MTTSARNVGMRDKFGKANPGSEMALTACVDKVGRVH